MGTANITKIIIIWHMSPLAFKILWNAASKVGCTLTFDPTCMMGWEQYYRQDGHHGWITGFCPSCAAPVTCVLFWIWWGWQSPYSHYRKFCRNRRNSVNMSQVHNITQTIGRSEIEQLSDSMFAVRRLRSECDLYLSPKIWVYTSRFCQSGLIWVCPTMFVLIMLDVCQAH